MVQQPAFLTMAYHYHSELTAMSEKSQYTLNNIVVTSVIAIEYRKIVRVIKSRSIWWARHIVRMAKCRGAYRVLVGKPEGKRQLGRHRRRWEDNIKMDLQEVLYEDMDWIELAQDRDRWWALVNAAVKIRVP